MKKTLAIIVISAAVVACNKSAQQGTSQTVATQSTVATSAATTTAELPPGHPAVTGTMPTTAAPGTGAPAGNLSGTVAETMDAGGYTYIKVKTASGSEEWAATPPVKVKKGQQVTIIPQMVAQKFESNTLKRTFDRIVFGSVAGTVAPSAPGSMMSGQQPAGHGGMDSASAMGTPQQHMAAPNAGDIKVPKAEGPEGKTVAEIWGSKAALADKPVVVRGKVVKFLGGIMGKNWMHLRDGSGAPGSDDITITTNDMATVGDVVLVKGVVRVDKDFGAGYRYAVIVEDGKISK